MPGVFSLAKLLSVVIPTFDRQALTCEAIESVRSDFPDLVEIVVVDDAGVRPFEFEGRQNQAGVEVVVHRLASNLGAGGARAAGVLMSRGQYVAFLDSDDRFRPQWVDRLIAVIRLLPGRRIFVVGNASGGGRVYRGANWLLRQMSPFSRLFVARLVVGLFNPFYTPAVSMSKQAYSSPVELRRCEDYYVNARSLFLAEELMLFGDDVCDLGRPPGSEGGLSHGRSEMQAAEWHVRRVLVGTKEIPWWWRRYALLGFAYQWLREVLLSLSSAVVRFRAWVDRKVGA